MKIRHKQRIISGFTVFVIALFFIGCSKIAPLADITVHPSIPVNLNVTIPPATGIMSTNSSNYAFSDSVTIDPTTDTLVTKYENYIKSWQVDSITGIFTNVSKPVNLTNVSLRVKPEGGDSFGWQIPNISINNGTNLVLNNSNGQLDKLGTVLQGTQTFKVLLSGTSGQDDIHFTLSVKINTTLVANPLGSV